MAGQAAQAHEIGLELGEPHVARERSGGRNGPPHDAVDGEAVPGLEAAHRRLDIGIEDIGVAGGGFEIAGDHQALAQRQHARMAVAEPQAVGLRHLGPAARATIPSNGAIACSVVSTVDGDSVGSDAFGMWMVREAESKFWPRSRRLVLVDQGLQRGVGATSAADGLAQQRAAGGQAGAEHT